MKYLKTALILAVLLALPLSAFAWTARTITDPANGSSISSAVMRTAFQTLENEIAAAGTYTTNYGSTAFSTSSIFWFTNGVQASSTSYLGTLYATGLTSCSGGSSALQWSGGTFSCGTITTSGAFPFSSDTNFGVQVYSTSTPTLWFKSGVYASSTSYFTNLNVNGGATTTSLGITSLLSKLLKTDGSGNVVGATAGTDYAPATSGSTLLLGNGSGAFSNYAGTSCTNQVPTANSTAGAWTCSSVTDSFLSGAVGIAHGGTNATSFGTSNGIVAYDGTKLTNFSGYTLTSSGITLTSASTTNLSASTYLGIPNGASQTGTTAGQIGFDTTDNQLKVGDGSAADVFASRNDGGFVYATSSFGSGTTTIKMSGFYQGTSIIRFGCVSKGTGTFGAVLGTGSATSTFVTSATGNTTSYTTLSSNNTFTSGQAVYIDIGTVSGTVADPSCSYSRTVTGT